MSDAPDLSGLKWVHDAFGPEPEWTRQPDLVAVKRSTQEVLCWNGYCTISFFDANAFNKKYVVKCGHIEFLTSVTLPVDPEWKTLSEVATMQWIKENTKIPVPYVHYFTACRANRIGFEYIVMTKLPGEPLEDVWASSNLRQKEMLVRQLARINAEMFSTKFRGIGNIYRTTPRSEGSSQAVVPGGTNQDGTSQVVRGLPPVERIVSVPFIWGNRSQQQNVSRGPFRNSQEWLSARLRLCEEECRDRIIRVQRYTRFADDDDDCTYIEGENLSIENLRKAFNIISRLKRQLSVLFPVTTQEPEPTVLFHDDLFGCNVLANHGQGITGVVNWECISTVPLWYACRFPCFLDKKSTRARPVRGIYEGLRTSEANRLWQAILSDPENVRLGATFREEMTKLQPEWLQIFDTTVLKREFEFAVSHYDEEEYLDIILGWLDDDLQCADSHGSRRALGEPIRRMTDTKEDPARASH